MLRHIDDSMNSWQWPGLRHRLVFALLGVLIALSYALLLDSEEAEAKGGKQSPNVGSAEGAIGESAKTAQEVVGEANQLASNEGGKDAGSLAAGDPAPRADKPALVENGTVRDAARSTNTDQLVDKTPSVVDQLPETNPSILEPTGSLGELSGMAREATRPAIEPVLDENATSVVGPGLEEKAKLPRAEPILEEAAKLEVAPVLNRATSETAPILERATSPVRPVLDETSSTVEPLLDTASSEIKPILERATAPVSPVLERTTSTVEPLFGEANPPVKPALIDTLPAVESALNGAVPVIDEPVGGTIEPVAWPLGEEAIPIVGPVFEDVASPGVEPAVGAVGPVFKSVFETVTPVVGSGLRKGVVHQNIGPPVLEPNVGAIPVSLAALQPRALAVEARDLLGSARDYDPVYEESPASVVEPPGSLSRLFNGSFVIDGSHTALLGAIMAEDTRQGPPRPFPFGFPPAAPPVGISFGSSSGAVVALDLLAILALLPILSRVGGLSWSNRAAFKLSSSLQLAVERPG